MSTGTVKKWRISNILIIILVALLAASLIGMFAFKNQVGKQGTLLKEHSANTASVMYELLRHDVRDDLINATKYENYITAADKIALYKKIPYCGYSADVAMTLYSYLLQLEKDIYTFADAVKAGQVENQDEGRSKLVRTTELIGTLCGMADEYVSGKLPKDSEIKTESDLIAEMKKTYNEQMKADTTEN